MHSRSSTWLATFLFACALPIAAEAQTGWIKSGTHPNDYEMGIDDKQAFTGSSSGFVRSLKTPASDGFGTYMQAFSASEYRGKRVRMTAYLKTADVKGIAGAWLRVDSGLKPSAFDNMTNRPLTGTNDWRQISIVLDVEPQATALAFGVLLMGAGAAWIDDVFFEVVGPDVPVTDILKAAVGTAVPPRNLDFESSNGAR